jgi:quinol-cytochrome oxidoreductase complex cytochrome b subunit
MTTQKEQTKEQIEWLKTKIRTAQERIQDIRADYPDYESRAITVEYAFGYWHGRQALAIAMLKEIFNVEVEEIR